MAALDLDATEARIHDLAHEVDNVHVPVQYRAPMAELERVARNLLAEVRLARDVREALREMPVIAGPMPVLEAWWNEEMLPALIAYDTHRVGR